MKQAYKKILSLIIFSLFLPCVFAQNVWNGVIHMRSDVNLDKQIIFLNGLWEYYPGQQFATFNREKYDMTFIHVPGSWNSQAKEVMRTNYACYRLKIMGLDPHRSYAFVSRESPATACRFYCNGNMVKSYGMYTTDEKYAIPVEKTMCFTVTPDSLGSIEFVVQVSNYTSKSAGITSPIGFATEERVLKRVCHTVSWVCFLFGLTIVTLSITVAISYGNKNRKRHMVFGILILGILSRILISDGNFLDLLLPGIPYSIMKRLEYTSLWLSPSLFSLLFLWDKFYNKKLAFVDKILHIGFGLLGLYYWVFPPSITNYSEGVLNILDIMFMFYAVFRAVRSWRHGDKRQVFTVMFYIIIELGVAVDFFFNQYILMNYFTGTQIAVFVIQIVNIIVIAFSHQEIFSRKNQLLSILKKKNEIYSRLISKEFVGLIARSNPEDVMLGDYVEETMTIMYMQLYPIIQSGKKMMPKREFELYSEFVKVICDCVKDTKGFITNFTGSGCIALFPGEVSDAIRASKEIEVRIEEWNENLDAKEGTKIKVTGGIHYGDMIFGVVGEEQRLDNTVISDTVNTASRINAVAYKIGESFLISQTAVDHIEKGEEFDFQRFGNTVLKGKGELLTLYKIKGAEDEEEKPATVNITQDEIDLIVKNLW